MQTGYYSKSILPTVVSLRLHDVLIAFSAQKCVENNYNAAN